MNNLDRKIKNWMKSQHLNDYYEGPICFDFRNPTQLGENASAALGFEIDSEEDERCFELAFEVLENFEKLTALEGK